MIARQRASSTRTPIGSRAHEENYQQLHDPIPAGSPSFGWLAEFRDEPSPARVYHGHLV